MIYKGIGTMNKRIFLRMFFLFEVIVFTFIYLFGTHGMQAVMQLRNENYLLADQVSSLKAAVKELKSSYCVWQSKPFYKEKIAREHLHMARGDEIIYYTS
jgi:cell division protein FtsB